MYSYSESHSSAVGIESGYGLKDRGIEFRVPVKQVIVTSHCTNRRWSLASILSICYRGLFTGEVGKAAEASSWPLIFI
jgi:hypothetical protein